MVTNGINLRTIGDKLRMQIECGNVHLLSELNLDLEEVEIIRSSANRLISSVLRGMDTFDIQTAYLMMDIGMRFYDEGTYWEDFWSQVGMEANSSRQSTLGTFFNNTIVKYDLAMAETRGRKYVNMILMHAFIPERYGNDFFDFVHKYYRVVLKGSVPDNLDSELSVFEEVFSDDDTTKSYPELKNVQLIVPTRLALTNKKYYAPILTKIIKRIANDYESTEDVRLGIYEDLFKKWTKKEKKRGKTNSDVNSPPTIIYDLVRGELYMLIPPQILKPEDGLVGIVESSYGKMLHRFNVTQYSQFHNMISDEVVFRISWNPLDKFRVRIGERVLYENDNQVIFFNKNGQKRTKVSLGFNMVILPKEEKIDIQTHDMAEGEDYVVKGFLMKRGDKFCISGQTYIIEEEVLESLHIVSDYLDLECIDQDGNKYNVYSQHPTLSIALNQERRARLKLSIGRLFNRIYYDSNEDLINDPVITRDTDSNYVVNLVYKDLPQENGIYTIRYRGRDVYRYVLLRDFSYRFEKELYESDEESRLYYYGNSEGIAFNTTQGVVKLPDKSVDGRQLSIYIQVPSRRFSFDAKNWMLFNSSELYFRDVEKKQFYVYCPTLVFPQITADYGSSVPKNPLKLEIQGPYLTCEFKKIIQVGNIIEHNRMYVPVMRFKCGRFDLFTIRYTADYLLTPGRIKRSLAPRNTYAVCEYDSGEKVNFIEDMAILPSDILESVNVFEYYDDGFNEGKRFAFHANTQPRLRTGKEFIQRGETPNKLKVVFNGETITYDWDQVNYLTRLDGPFDKDYREYVRRFFSADGIGRHSLELYDLVCELIKETILDDTSTERLKIRIQRFKDVDIDFSIKLCERCLDIRSDCSVINQLSQLKQLKNKTSPTQ